MPDRKKTPGAQRRVVAFCSMPRRSRTSLLGGLLAASLMLWIAILPSTAAAVVDVFHSPDQSGSNPGSTPEIPGSAAPVLHLYIENSGAPTSAGTVCEDGNGNELCGYDLTFSPVGGVQFLSFVPAAGVIHAMTADRLRLNAVPAVSGIGSSTFVGDLQVDTTFAVNARIDLQPSEVLDASLNTAALASRTIATVPEPGLSLLICSGVVGLILMSRHRRGPRS